MNVYIILGGYKQIIISSCIECHERLNKHASTLEFNLAPLLLLINKCTFEYYTGWFVIRGAIKTKATQRNGKHHGPYCVYYILYAPTYYYHDIVVEGSRLHFKVIY